MTREEKFQIACMDWMRWLHPNVNAFHVPNGGSRSKILIRGKLVCVEGEKFKRMGVKPGVSDVLILVPRGKYHGAILELKTEDGKLSPEQESFLRQCAKDGYYAAALFSFNEFTETVTWYLNLK